MPNGENPTIHLTEPHPIEPQPTDQDIAKQEESLLQALLKKGPALPIELAVRTYSFPEEIAEPLSNLEQAGFVERQAMKTGEMIVLTKKGQDRIKGPLMG
jgi:DNA-binding MarR family transcriptional regulator